MTDAAHDPDAADDAHGRLARAVARLAETSMLTTVDLDEVGQVTQALDELEQRLAARRREADHLGSEVTGGGVRNHGNAVTGLRNPFATAPDPDQRWVEDDRLVFELRLGAAYEGPPGHVHGGALALVIDQVLGEAAAVFGGPGMTGRLTLHFRRATRIGRARVEAWLESTDGTKTVMKGRLLDAQGHLCVEAEGLFIFPRWAADHPHWQELARHTPVRPRRDAEVSSEA